MQTENKAEKCGTCGSLCSTSSTKCGLKISAVAIASGIVCGLGFFMLAIYAWKFKHGMPIVELLESMYKGYAPTLKGGLIGLGWGFLKGFVWGGLFAWIYNCCAKCLCCKGSCKTCDKHQGPAK